MIVKVAAVVFTVLTGIVMIFQGCLAVGLPWGAASMGGKFPGKYPPKMRFAAVLNIFFLMFLTVIILSAAGLYFEVLGSFAAKAVWGVVVLMGAGTVMNIITPSKIERIWAPVASIQFVCALIIALS